MNKKVKKLGKYFTKGLQAGVLATALIAGNVSYSNAAGGSSPEFNKGTDPENDEWYIQNGNLDGQRFVKSNADWTFDYINQNDEFDTHYSKAKKFMDAKVTELQGLVKGQTNISLYKEIDTALNKFQNDKSNNISTNITTNYNALAPVFATMVKTLTSNDNTADFHAFNASYHKLAANAYNQSLGVMHGQTTFKTNREMIDDHDNFFLSELGYANLKYSQVTNSYAKTKIADYLTTIAKDTHTNDAVLKKVIELALYNESLYGLNDFARECGVNKTTLRRERSLDTFYTAISNAFYKLQSIDDRTM